MGASWEKRISGPSFLPDSRTRSSTLLSCINNPGCGDFVTAAGTGRDGSCLLDGWNINVMPDACLRYTPQGPSRLSPDTDLVQSPPPFFLYLVLKESDTQKF